MRHRLHVWSLALGMFGGVGLTLLVGAAGPRDAGGAAGRYQIRTAARESTSTAFVVDTVTGEVAIVSEHGGGPGMVKPQWGK